MRFLASFAFACLFAVNIGVAHSADKDPLPRVLIIGDTVYSQHARKVTSELKGRAEVTFASWQSDEIPTTKVALDNLDRLLGYVDRDGKPLAEENRPRWAVIHLNLGLGDLVHRAPNMESYRLLPIPAGGVRSTAPREYGANLDELVSRLKATDAEVIWASTTPIRASSSRVFELGSEIEYNQIAARVMKKHGVPTNDMYSYAKSVMNMDKPASHGADPFSFDKKELHPPVVEAIRQQLK